MDETELKQQLTGKQKQIRKTADLLDRIGHFVLLSSRLSPFFLTEKCICNIQAHPFLPSHLLTSLSSPPLLQMPYFHFYHTGRIKRSNYLMASALWKHGRNKLGFNWRHFSHCRIQGQGACCLVKRGKKKISNAATTQLPFIGIPEWRQRSGPRIPLPM